MRHDLQKVKVKGQGQGHEGHKIVRILKMQYLLHFFSYSVQILHAATQTLCSSYDEHDALNPIT